MCVTNFKQTIKNNTPMKKVNVNRDVDPNGKGTAIGNAIREFFSKESVNQAISVQAINELANVPARCLLNFLSSPVSTVMKPEYEEKIFNVLSQFDFIKTNENLAPSSNTAALLAGELEGNLKRVAEFLCDLMMKENYNVNIDKHSVPMWYEIYLEEKRIKR